MINGNTERGATAVGQQGARAAEAATEASASAGAATPSNVKINGISLDVCDTCLPRAFASVCVTLGRRRGRS